MSRTGLLTQRCHNHEQREAAARCPECAGYFCRECITEHMGRVLCRGCLKRLTKVDPKGPRRFGLVLPALLWVCGCVVAWLFFYQVGRILVATPTELHEGKMWDPTVENQ